MVKHTTLWLATWMLLSTPARAQAPPLKLTLDEAVARGLANSLKISELQARQEAATAVEQSPVTCRKAEPSRPPSK